MIGKSHENAYMTESDLSGFRPMSGNRLLDILYAANHCTVLVPVSGSNQASTCGC